MRMSPEVTPRPPLVVPRGLVFLATGWLVGSWLLAVGLTRPIMPSSAVYEPGAHIFLCSMVVGVLVAWPLLRLSGPLLLRSHAVAMLDLVALAVLVQIVLWPLRLMTSWTVERAALIDALLLGFILVGGALIAMATARGGGVRVMASIALLAWLIVPLFIEPFLSPLGLMWEASSGSGEVVGAGTWVYVAFLGIAGGVLWALSGLSRVKSGTLRPS